MSSFLAVRKEIERVEKLLQRTGLRGTGEEEEEKKKTREESCGL